VTIDLLTDSGTTAVSTDQWAAYDAALPTPATSDAFLEFAAAVRDICGYQHVLPAHQGRAAEQVLSEVLIRPGQLVPGNMYFTTTKVHEELAGGIFVDVIVDEAHDPTSSFRWKSNIDLAKLDRLVAEHGAAKFAYISFEQPVNMAGGVPVLEPTGGHAVFLDARRFLPQIDQDEYPAQRLAGEIYLETGVRARERGNVSKGRDPQGQNDRPALELVRLTLPRRVYSDDHLREVASGILRVFERRAAVEGLRFTYEPPTLRFFQGRFEPLG
jgi:tryptophanase